MYLDYGGSSASVSLKLILTVMNYAYQCAEVWMNRPSLHCSWKAREMAHLLTLKLISRVDWGECEEENGARWNEWPNT